MSTMRAMLDATEEFLADAGPMARRLIRQGIDRNFRDLATPVGPRVWRVGRGRRLATLTFVAIDGPDAVEIGHMLRRARRSGDPDWAFLEVG